MPANLDILTTRPRASHDAAGPANDAPTVIIVGGGLAGLGAAVALAERGLSVTLLESRPRLGGRAGSFVDQATGETIDACQHVAMGCCTNFAHFCETTGLSRFLRAEPALHFVGPDNRVCEFRAADRPAPFHLASAFGGLTYLSRRERLAIARGLRALARRRPGADDARSFAEWLRDHRQPPSAAERFWNVVLVSALSESLDRIDVDHARKVFVDGFLAHRRGWIVRTPTVALDVLYGSELVEWLHRRGATVRVGAGVERVVTQGDRATGVVLRNGERLEADDVILAVPPPAVASLLPPGLLDHPSLTGMQRLEFVPITSVHLWFREPITPLPHAVFVGRLSHWLFARPTARAESPPPPTAASGLLLSAVPPASPGLSYRAEASAPATASPPASGRAESHYYQVVISASRNLDGVPPGGIIHRVVEELREVWTAARRVDLLHARVVTEHRAVFSPRPGVDALRPVQQTPIGNLQLAGDWTRTGWPATMEGAVRSGYLAAENVLRRHGRPACCLQPDLPPEWLARLLFGFGTSQNS